MRVALVVLEIQPDPTKNRAAMAGWVGRAAAEGADLVVFPEGAPTGLVNNDDPAHDLPLGEQIPGPSTEAIGAAARASGIHVAFGLIEREGDVLYDTAVLLDPGGRVTHHHRRTHPGWHSSRADPAVYREGQERARIDTAFGSLAFVICGELFDDAAVRAARDLQADAVLVLLWRCFEDGSTDQARWEREELDDYTARAALLETNVLMVNGLAPTAMEGGSFGGAWVWDPGGRLVTSLPLGQSGLLLTVSS